MTTIAYKDGVLAGDRMAWLGRGAPGNSCRSKIRRLQSGSLVGITSTIVGASTALFDWLDRGRPIEAIPNIQNGEITNAFEMLIIGPEGGIEFFEDGFWPTTIEGGPIAIGSGQKYAMGAMWAGCTAPGAIQVAGALDQFTGSGVDILRLGGTGYEQG